MGMATAGWKASGLAERAAAWRYAIPGSRDYRLDLVRGFLVFCMVIDHLGGDSPLTAITGNNQFFVSAAEGFIFISGLLMGVVYGGRVKRLGLGVGVRATLLRARFLYVVFVGLTLAFVGLFLFTDYPLWMDRNGGLGVKDPLEALVGTFTLHYSYHGTDIILIYVTVVAAAPLAFYLLATGRWIHLLGGSWLLWAIYQVFPQTVFLPFPNSEEPTFALAAWQALFLTGLALGYHRDRVGILTRILDRPATMLLLVLATVGLIVLSGADHARQLSALGIPGVDDDSFYPTFFGKTHLAVGRVVAFAVVGSLARQVITFLWVPIEHYLGWLLVPLGQKSLLSYGFHLFLLGPFYALFSQALWVDPASPILNALIQASLIGIVWSVVKLNPGARLDWLVGLVRQQALRPLARRP